MSDPTGLSQAGHPLANLLSTNSATAYSAASAAIRNTFSNSLSTSFTLPAAPSYSLSLPTFPQPSPEMRRALSEASRRRGVEREIALEEYAAAAPFRAVNRAFEQFGNGARATGNAIGTRIEQATSGYGGPIGDLIAGTGGFIAQHFRTEGSVVAALDLPRTVHSSAMEILKTVEVGQRYGVRTAAAHHIGLLQGTEALYRTDVMSYDAVDPWSKASEASGRLGAAAGMGAGIARLAGSVPQAPVRTNAQLIDEIASRADAWGTRQGFTGTAQKIGTAKHVYARDLLTRYQDMFGSRGLSTEVRYVNQTLWQPNAGMPTTGSVILDIVEGNLTNPTAIYDYKFGAAGLSPPRINQIRQVGGFGNAVPVIEVRP